MGNKEPSEKSAQEISEEIANNNSNNVRPNIKAFDTDDLYESSPSGGWEVTYRSMGVKL